MSRLLALCFALCLGVTAFAQSADSDIDATTINPRYLLQDPNGRAVTSEDFRGRFQLIAFGYTYCPDICPTTLVDMAAVLKALGKHADHLQALFITVDPERDSGEVLKSYTTFFDPRIIGLTGSPALIRRTADNFRIRYAKVDNPGGDPAHYSVDHSAGMYLLGPDGRFIAKFAYATPSAEISGRIAALLESF